MNVFAQALGSVSGMKSVVLGAAVAAVTTAAILAQPAPLLSAGLTAVTVAESPSARAAVSGAVATGIAAARSVLKALNPPPEPQPDMATVRARAAALEARATNDLNIARKATGIKPGDQTPLGEDRGNVNEAVSNDVEAIDCERGELHLISQTQLTTKKSWLDPIFPPTKASDVAHELADEEKYLQQGEAQLAHDLHGAPGAAAIGGPAAPTPATVGIAGKLGQLDK